MQLPEALLCVKHRKTDINPVVKKKSHYFLHVFHFALQVELAPGVW